MEQGKYLGSAVHLENLRRARALVKIIKTPCKRCGNDVPNANLKRHEEACSNGRNCPVCSTWFYGRGTTCSKSCSNTFFRSGQNHPNWKQDSYRTTCFQHHEKKCVVCGEQNIVEVHHLDEDKQNNSPENLIPLCPTHHQYWHSNHKEKVESIVMNYVYNRASCSH